MPTPEQHAYLSASSSHRWLHCTRAPQLEAQFPAETTSDYAEAGRVAHAVAELKARKYFLEPMSTRMYNARLKKLKEDPHYDKGMDSATDTYLDYLKNLAISFGIPPFVALETRVDFSRYAPDGFGTADCIIIGAGRICVVDYKNGSGVPVDAENNSQMMLYALGALEVYAPIYGNSIQEIHLAIVQPNAGGVKEWNLTRAALEEWGESFAKPRAALAYAGEGEYCPGDWCRFCKAAAQCSARAAKMLELEPLKGTDPALLTDAQVGDVLARALDMDSWIKALKEYALSAALAGREISGFKVVEGRGGREWSDLDTAFKVLQDRGLDEALLWERKPVTPPALEKALGKKAFSESAADLTIKKPGKPTLVPASDKRPPYNAAQIAFGGAANG